MDLRTNNVAQSNRFQKLDSFDYSARINQYRAGQYFHVYMAVLGNIGKRIVRMEKVAMRLFRVLSVWVVPLVYLSLGVSLMLSNAKSAVAYFEGNYELSLSYSE